MHRSSGGTRVSAAIYAAVAAVLAAAVLLVPAVSATHEEDGFFDQQVVLNWDTATIDVLVVPATVGQPGNVSDLDPLDNSMRRGVEAAIRDWEAAIQIWGSAWLRENVVLRVHWATAGAPPVQDPEIVVLHEDAADENGMPVTFGPMETAENGTGPAGNDGGGTQETPATGWFGVLMVLAVIAAARRQRLP